MSATNHTVTIGLSQYVSTDKPTYLVDYNGDMLAIDNAIAIDRGNITDAKNTATTADGKADANKTSIDSLNVQINGDPEDPTDVGIAGDLNAVEGTVNTVTSLIGNGSPTTSDQTIIGAINNLEGSVAPREDSATLANNYVIGAKFARGGSVYEALASLTAGTAFASLVLNTDYKVADTLVKQIEDAASGSGVIANIVNSVEASIAPREDGTTLSASYSQGDQFIRAGVLYEALVSLTAGDTFASLVLNTDYKVADTLIKQIEDAASSGTLPNGFYIKSHNNKISKQADGTKTLAALLNEAAAELLTTAQALNDGEYLVITGVRIPNKCVTPNSGAVPDNQNIWYNNAATKITCSVLAISVDTSTGINIYNATLSHNASRYVTGYQGTSGGSWTMSDEGATTPASGSVAVGVNYDVISPFA